LIYAAELEKDKVYVNYNSYNTIFYIITKVKDGTIFCVRVYKDMGNRFWHINNTHIDDGSFLDLSIGSKYSLIRNLFQDEE
jgi:hypothetical protein